MRKAWQTSGDVFGVVVQIGGLAARLPSSAVGEFFILTLRVDPHLRLNTAEFMTREAVIR